MEFEIEEGINPRPWQGERTAIPDELSRRTRKAAERSQSALYIPESDECLTFSECP